MDFNRHLDLEGQHAFLGASKYHWINYTDDKLAESYQNFLAVQRGTELHAFAAQAIRHGIKLQKSAKTLNMYVNDAIGFKMTPEQVLYYSENCFGTADAISFRNDFLRIHDLKTGTVPAHMEQLRIYAALFCLEYQNVVRKQWARNQESHQSAAANKQDAENWLNTLFDRERQVLFESKKERKELEKKYGSIKD